MVAPFCGGRWSYAIPAGIPVVIAVLAAFLFFVAPHIERWLGRWFGCP